MSNLEKLRKNVGQIAEQAAQRADEKLAAELKQLTQLSVDQVRQYFPDAGDQEKFMELMRIVKSSADRNEKINKLSANAKNFSGVVLTLLTKLA
jgi:hypothetical protein